MNNFNDIEYSEKVFEDIILTKDEIISKEFYDCNFIKCDFSESFLQNCKFYDCNFENSNLSSVKIKNSAYSNTSFKNSKLVGINWTEATWERTQLYRPINFFECNISYSTFLAMKLKEIEIIGCLAKDVDFREADLTEANFKETNLVDSLFLNTNLTKTNFRNAKNYTIDITINKVKQAKFTLPEAMALLYSLDIQIT
ncbi:MAG: pentapeptide repeat-containing protein [Bacteroidetes bacterium]|nr:pentapeptide repeat-containing protein [Bacteroidota bacterium]